MQRAMVDRWVSQRQVTAEASLVLIQRRFGGRFGKLRPSQRQVEEVNRRSQSA